MVADKPTYEELQTENRELADRLLDAEYANAAIDEVRRAAWRQYACAALAGIANNDPDAPTVPNDVGVVAFYANSMLALEEEHCK